MGGSWGLRPNVDKDSHFLKGTPHMTLTDWKVDQNYHHWFISVFLPSWPLSPSASSSPSPVSFLLCIELKYYELEVCIYQITSSDKRLLCSEHFLVGRIFRRHPGFFVLFCLLLHKVYKKSGNNLSKINELWFWNPVLWPPGAVTFLHLVYLPPSVSHVTLLHVLLLKLLTRRVVVTLTSLLSWLRILDAGGMLLPPCLLQSLAPSSLLQESIGFPQSFWSSHSLLCNWASAHLLHRLAATVILGGNHHLWSPWHGNHDNIGHQSLIFSFWVTLSRGNFLTQRSENTSRQTAWMNNEEDLETPTV